jgi:hypothetical protein
VVGDQTIRGLGYGGGSVLAFIALAGAIVVAWLMTRSAFGP